MKRIGSTAVQLAPDRHWTTRALCGPQDTADFYPEGSKTAVDDADTFAKNLCGRCPVRLECLAWAHANGEEHGTWGGLTASERTALRPRRASTGGGRRLAPCGTPAAYERHRRLGEPIDQDCWANRSRKKQKEVAA